MERIARNGLLLTIGILHIWAGNDAQQKSSIVRALGHRPRNISREDDGKRPRHTDQADAVSMLDQFVVQNTVFACRALAPYVGLIEKRPFDFLQKLRLAFDKAGRPHEALGLT
jgi:hypothetical protein